MSAPTQLDLQSTYLRLRPDCRIEPVAVDEEFWPKLIAGKLGTFHNQYLVASHVFDSDWNSWEKHPNGDEIVCLISGRVKFILELESGNREVELDKAGSFVLVPQDTWHTAKCSQATTLLFITAGEGTVHRPAS